MADQRLVNYVKENLARGVRPDGIRNCLRQANYNNNEIEQAMITARQAPTQRPMLPVMQQQRFKPIKKSSWQAFKQWLKKIVPPEYRKYIPYAVLGAFVIGFIVLLTLSRQRPPVVEFFDNTSKKPVEGAVYYNGEFLGETKGVFNKLPKEFCKEPGTLEIVTRQGRISWPTEQSDCKQRRLELIMRLAPIGEVSFFVTLEFVTEDTGEFINGTLFSDGKKLGDILGYYRLYKGDCQNMQILNLTNIVFSRLPRNYVEWQHDVQKCEHDTIRYYIPTFSEEPIPEPEPVTKPKGINTTVVFRIQQELEKANVMCETFCPKSGQCTAKDKATFCSQFVTNVDLNGNGKFGDYVQYVLGDYGACEDRIYCSQIMNCQCNETLYFEGCIEIICQEFSKLGKTKEESTLELQKVLTEGSCQTDPSYDQKNSWYANFKEKLVCK